MALNIVSGDRYTLFNTKTGTVMDLSGSDSRSVIGWPGHGGENQQWELIFVGHGWHIRNVWQKEKYLAFVGDIGNGSKIVGSHEPFVWNIWPDKTEITCGRITVPKTTYDVDLNGASAAPGTNITLWSRWEPGPNQVWRFQKV